MENVNAVELKARSLGATEFESGINWMWASGFPTEDSAQTFTRYLDSIHYEHRGVYSPVPTNPNFSNGYSVRYR